MSVTKLGLQNYQRYNFSNARLNLNDRLGWRTWYVGTPIILPRKDEFVSPIPLITDAQKGLFQRFIDWLKG